MATQTKTLVSEILQAVSDLRGESSVNTDAVRIRYVTKNEKDLAKRMFWSWLRMPNQTTTGDGTNDYTIGSSTYPMRVKGLSEVFVDGTTESSRYTILDFNAYKAQYNLNNSAKICYEWYDVANDLWKVHINPAPETGKTITYTYFMEPATRTLTTEYVICPNPRIISLLVFADILDSEEEVQRAQIVRNEAEQLIEELMGIENAPAVNQTYRMEADINTRGTYGLGTY